VIKHLKIDAPEPVQTTVPAAVLAPAKAK
jgi:hypothetical protein